MVNLAFRQRSGVIPVLILVAIAGFLGFFATTTFFPFKDALFSNLFPKPLSRALGNPVGGTSQAYGLWKPSRFDTCTAEEHDLYFVTGVDGRRYPTWHPPVHKREDGSVCTFGHEHGRDPSGSELTADIKNEFGGLLFGYANEQILNADASLALTGDHVGHKVEWENNVPQGSFVCDYLAKIHQDTHSQDAFSNNLHELGYFVSCTDAGDSQNNIKLLGYKIVAFGKSGEFIDACDKTTVRALGGGNGSNDLDEGVRFLPTRACAEKHFLVPSGQFSDVGLGLYEDWVSGNHLRKKSDPNGNFVYFDPHFAVFNPSRYFYPGQANNLGKSVDLCWDVETNGDRARDGSCDIMTDYGKIGTPLAYDDTKSLFNGVRRELLLNVTWINNRSGPETWYCDPFGKNCQTSPAPGYIKWFIGAVDNFNKYQFQSEALGANREYGGQGVHAPN